MRGCVEREGAPQLILVVLVGLHGDRILGEIDDLEVDQTGNVAEQSEAGIAQQVTEIGLVDRPPLSFQRDGANL